MKKIMGLTVVMGKRRLIIYFWDNSVCDIRLFWSVSAGIDFYRTQEGIEGHVNFFFIHIHFHPDDLPF